MPERRSFSVGQVQFRFLRQDRISIVVNELLFRDGGQQLLFVAKLQGGPTRQTRPQREHRAIFRGKRLTEFREIGAWPHQAHIAAQNIQQLG